MKKLVLLSLLYLFASSVYSQFTYVSGGVSTGNINFLKDDLYGFKKTNVRDVSLNFLVSHRPIRNLALGIEVSIPVYQTSNSFIKVGTVDLNSEFSFGRYKPQKLEYSFEHSSVSTVFLQCFFETELNSFIEARFSWMKLDESLNIQRRYVPASYYWDGDVQYSSVHGVNYDLTETHNLAFPGLAIGISPQTKNQFYYSVKYNIDFINFGERPSFEYLPLSYRENPDANFADISDFVFISSQLVGWKIRSSFEAKLGYFF